MSDFYVYAHKTITPRAKGDIFYIGKGRGTRAWSTYKRNNYWKAVVAKYGYTVEIILGGLTEPQAFELEKSLIAISGRHVLCNMTDGGEGPSGAIRSEVTRLKMSEAQKGRPSYFKNRKRGPQSEEHKAKIAIHKVKPRGTHSPEWNSNISASQKGKVLSSITRDRLSAVKKGKPWTDARRLAQERRYA